MQAPRDIYVDNVGPSTLGTEWSLVSWITDTEYPEAAWMVTYEREQDGATDCIVSGWSCYEDETVAKRAGARFPKDGEALLKHIRTVAQSLEEYDLGERLIKTLTEA